MADTLAPLIDAKAPQNVNQLWKDYDPRAETLDVELLDEWEDNGVICRVVRYCVGTFHGKKSMIAALYGFPKGQKNLPGLVQVHGGSQHANLNIVTTNARRGYACISINWLANQMTGIKCGQPWKWEGIDTEWGGVDATQHTHYSHFGSLEPDEKTIDAVTSPRNSNWFLVILAARRALTFLEQQPEVDPSRLGMYGHSAGARVTFNTAAIDKRVRAAAPSCGAQAYISEGLFGQTIDCGSYAPKVTCPVIFLSPSNDGSADGIEQTIDLMSSREFRVTRDPHLNHFTQPPHVVCELLWMDQYLKDTFTMPQTPQTRLIIKNRQGVPEFEVSPDAASLVQSVDVYYTWGRKVVDRFWHYVRPTRKGNHWTAELSLISLDEPLRVYANVTYPLKKPITGASYYYEIYSTEEFTISSRMKVAAPQELKSQKCRVTERPSQLIEAFGPNWKKEWYTLNVDGTWPWRTRKLNDLKWLPPTSANLSLDIKAKMPNSILIQLDNYKAVAKLSGGNKWETIIFTPQDFTDSKQNEKLKNFTAFSELIIGPVETTDQGQPNITNGWSGELPVFRNLQWMEKK